MGACQLCRGSALATEASVGDLNSPRHRAHRGGGLELVSVISVLSVVEINSLGVLGEAGVKSEFEVTT